MNDKAKPSRNGPEWITFGVSALIVTAVVGLLVGQLVADDDPARPEARVVESEIVSRAGRFHVPVEVTNEGDRGAQSVHVTAELALGGETTTADQTVDFLGAEESVRLVFMFDDDPADGELTVVVDGFLVP